MLHHWRWAAVFVATLSVLACSQAVPTPTPTASIAAPSPKPTPVIAAGEAYEVLQAFIRENRDSRLHRQLGELASWDVGTWYSGVRAWVFQGSFPDDIEDPGLRGFTVIYRVFEDTRRVERLK